MKTIFLAIVIIAATVTFANAEKLRSRQECYDLAQQRGFSRATRSGGSMNSGMGDFVKNCMRGKQK